MSETRILSPFSGPGDYTNPRMVALMKTYCRIMHIGLSGIYCYQGSFNTSVAASAGTHDKADCLDLRPDFNVAVGKKIGFWSAVRETWQGPWIKHVHGVRMYTGDAAWLADAQEEAYRGWNSDGLGDLSHKDPAYHPKYRGVYHISGPTTTKFITTQETIGWREAGCHGSNDDDVSRFKKVTRAKGYIISNVAGRVRANGSEYLVVPSETAGVCTFYNVANVDVYVAPTATTYYVSGPHAMGHQDRSARSRRIGAAALCGTALKVLKTSTVNGATWGWVDPVDEEGRWYLMDNLSKTKPTSKIVRVDWLSVGAYNTAAQASGHTTDYDLRAPMSAENMVSADCNVWGVVEYGSSKTIHAGTGKTYLTLSDEARVEASEGDLRRMAHGGNWRHLLYQESNVDYVANSGRLLTLPTRIDTDGTQIVMGTVLKHSVKSVVCVVHFQVHSTVEQLRTQAIETLQAVTTYRKEMDVGPWNVTILGDFNDQGDTVRGVFSSWGFQAMGEYAPELTYAFNKTYNGWVDQWVRGSRIDEIYVFEGAAISWRQWKDAKASDHNFTKGVRASYGVAA